MKKEIKTYLDEEYTKIYSDLNVGWKIGVRDKTEELINKGLANSGFEQQTLTTLGTELIKKTNTKLKELLEETQKKFDFKLNEKELNEYINKSIKNNNSYLDIFEKELSEIFDKKRYELVESCKIMFNNAKGDSESELKGVNKDKKMNRSDKIAILGIVISAIIAIGLFILGLILT